jgi:hypothetical protein
MGFGAALSDSHGDELGDRGRETLDRIRRASARMGELIDAMLLLSGLVSRSVSENSHAGADLDGLPRAAPRPFASESSHRRGPSSTTTPNTNTTTSSKTAPGYRVTSSLLTASLPPRRETAAQ